MTKTFTDAEKKAWKEEKQREQKQLLEDALTDLAGEQMWENFVKYGRSNLSKYSFMNSILIFWQKQDATLVKGYKTWAKEGIKVNEGAKAIKIFAPIFVNVTDEDGNVLYDDDGKAMKRVGFYKTVNVFDISDTDAPTVENTRIMREISGDDLQEMIPELEKLARSNGITITYADDYEPIEPSPKNIIINGSWASNMMVHALIRGLVGSSRMELLSEYNREEVNVITESATVMALGMLDFDVRDVAVPYIVAWGGDTKKFKELAGIVDDLAKKITEKMGV